MADAESDQIVHGSPTAASELPTTPISSDRERVDGSSAPDTPGRVAESERSAPAADADAEHGGEHDDDVFSGRPDLAQDAIETLRARNKQLKKEQLQVKKQLKNQARKRARVIKRMKNLDTASVLQVLMDRGIDFKGHGGSSSSSAARTPKPARARATAASDAADTAA